MTETVTVTCTFVETKVEIEWSDRDDEIFRFVETSHHNNMMSMFEWSDDSWYIFTDSDDTPHLSYQKQDKDALFVNRDKIDGIRGKRNREFIAVAEIEIERTEQRSILGRTYTETSVDTDQDIGVDVWEKSEWNAHVDRDLHDYPIVGNDW